MDTHSAEAILRVIQVYGAIGALVALPFALFVAPRIDAGARGSSIAFRLMIVPGAIALWPVVLVQSVRKLRGADEGHR